jgi:hypothetical protein
MKKIISLILILVFLASFFLLSCIRKPLFSDIIITEEETAHTTVAAAGKRTFPMDHEAVYAMMRVKNVHAKSRWRFLWKDMASGETIMDQSDYYQSQKRGYVDGSISTFLPLRENKKAVLAPGKYEVFFYHEDMLQASTAFEIISPEIRIIDSVFSKSIDGNRKPAEITDVFGASDTVYVFVKTNYQIPDNRLTVAYFDSKGDLLVCSSIDFNDYYFEERFSVFSLSGEGGLLMPDRYHAKIYLNEHLYATHSFTVRFLPDDIQYIQEKTYENNAYAFSILYPDNWDYVEDEKEHTLRIDLIPPEEGLPMGLVMHVIKKGNFPSREDISLLAKEFSENIADENGLEHIEARDAKPALQDDMDYDKFVFEYQSKEDARLWSAVFSFLIRDDLYILMSLSDAQHKEASNRMHARILESIKFP